MLQIIHPQTHLDAPQHILHHTGIAAHRDPLIERVEVIIVKGVSDRQPADNESRKLIAGTPPLLLRVAPDQFLIDICSDEADRLLLQIFRVRDPRLPALPADFFLRFLRRHDTPHFIEGIHIEGQRIQLTVVIRYGGIGEAVEIRKLSYIIPDAGIAGMKNMSAIPMHMYPFDFFCIDIACHLRPAVNHQHALACLMRPLCKYSAEKPGANDQIIILFHYSLRFPDLIRRDFFFSRGILRYKSTRTTVPSAAAPVKSDAPCFRIVRCGATDKLPSAPVKSDGDLMSSCCYSYYSGSKGGLQEFPLTLSHSPAHLPYCSRFETIICF